MTEITVGMQVLLAVGNTVMTADIDDVEIKAPSAGIQKLAEFCLLSLVYLN